VIKSIKRLIFLANHLNCVDHIPFHIR